MESSKNSGSVIVGLDLVRFVAASLVMFDHLCASEWAAPESEPYIITGGKAVFPGLFAFTSAGWIGVQIFFVLSGIVIAYSAGGGATAKTFLMSRFLRLYPAVWICAPISAITIITIHFVTLRHAIREFVYSMTLFPLPPWVDPVYWTLRIEMCFYAVIFILLFFKKLKHLEFVMFFIGGISSAYWIIGDFLAPHFLANHLYNSAIEMSLLMHGCFFAMGTLIYIISRDGLSVRRVGQILTFFLSGMIQISYVAQYVNLKFVLYSSPLVAQSIFAVMLFAMIGSMSFSIGKSHKIARLFRLIGLATYPLYLFHQMVGAAIMHAILEHGGSRYEALSVAVTFCITISILIANVLEPPLRRFVRRGLLLLSDVFAYNGNKKLLPYR